MKDYIRETLMICLCGLFVIGTIFECITNYKVDRHTIYYPSQAGETLQSIAKDYYSLNNHKVMSYREFWLDFCKNNERLIALRQGKILKGDVVVIVLHN